MSTLPRITLAAIGLTSALLLSGCIAPELEKTRTPSPSATPVFSSEDEALAAVTDAYDAYLAVSDQIFSEGSVDGHRLMPFVTPEYLKTELEGLADFRESGKTTVGPSAFDTVRMLKAPRNFVSGERITVYLCIDVTDARLLDSELVDITPPDRPNRLPLDIQFVISADDIYRVLIDGSDVSSHGNIC